MPCHLHMADQRIQGTHLIQSQHSQDVYGVLHAVNNKTACTSGPKQEFWMHFLLLEILTLYFISDSDRTLSVCHTDTEYSLLLQLLNC